MSASLARISAASHRSGSTRALAVKNSAKAPQGKKGMAESGVLAPPRRVDYHSWLAGDLTPATIKSILTSTLYGSARQQNEAFDKMLRDAHFGAEYDKRLMAVGRLQWDIRSASQVREGDLSPEESATADEIAAYVRAVMGRIQVVGHGIEGAAQIGAGLAHLDDAIGRGLAGLEQEWETRDVRLPSTRQAGQTRATTRTISARVPVRWHLLAPGRWRYDPTEPWRLRLLLDESDYLGAALDEFPAGKFIVHAPRSLGGSAFRGALHIPALLLFYAKSYGWKWFCIAVELFGQPSRVAKLPKSATPAEWAAALEMLTQMGTSACGVFSADTAIDLLTSQFTGGGTQSMYERMIKMCDAGASVNYIGNAMTTEVQNAEGSKTQPTVVADEVREDIRDKDIANKNATLTEQAVKAIVRMSPYAESDEALWPEYQTVVPVPQDDIRDMDLIGKGQKIGKQFTAGMIAERFGWPLVGEEKEDTVLAPQVGFDSFSPFGGGDDIASERAAKARARGLREKACAAMDKILQRGSPMARMIPWVLAASLASQAHSATVLERFDAALAALAPEALTPSLSLGERVKEVLWPAFIELPTADLQELTRQTLVTAELAGRARTFLSLRRERPLAEEIKFESLPFVEAIENLRDRIGLKPEAFLDLDRAARSRAFRIAGVWDMDLLAVLHTQLVRSIANGETVRDFRERVMPLMLDRDGWTGEKPWHATLVFFQNMAAASAAGSYRQMVEAEIGHWIFRGYGDSCPLCAPLNGKVFSINDTAYIPPLHFRCDCDKDPVFDHELPRHEVTSSAETPNEALEGYRQQRSAYQFDVRQYAGLEPMPLARFPEVYHAPLRTLAAERGWDVAEEK